MKIGIVATGTELTMGQILNKNAQTISEILYQKFGVETIAHIAVPDDRLLITEALNFLSDKCDCVFTTGGLGPTRDDFTREVVSAWANSPLEYNEVSWKHLQLQLSKRNRTATEMHIQECFFPVGAKIFTNFVGTANAFSFSPAKKSQIKNIFVLPGPPKEIEGLWHTEIEPEIEKLTENLDRRLTKSWVTHGIPEAVVAEAVEAVVKGCPFEIGFRLNTPEVEVKLTYKKSEEAEVEIWISKISVALQKWLPKN